MGAVNITWGGGSSETPKLYYVIYEQPLMPILLRIPHPGTMPRFWKLWMKEVIDFFTLIMGTRRWWRRSGLSPPWNLLLVSWWTWGCT